MPSYLISVQLPSSTAAELNENKSEGWGPLMGPLREFKAPKMVKNDKDRNIFNAICYVNWLDSFTDTLFVEQ